MSNPASNDSPTLQDVSDDLAFPVSQTVRCPRCAADLASLPDTARFCPRCGAEMRAGLLAGCVRSPAAIETEPIYVTGRWRHFDTLTGCSRRIRTATPLGPSMILEGYANALYKLGRRYETAIGAAHIPQEAERCYRKAARLGNFWALARLAATWFV